MSAHSFSTRSRRRARSGFSTGLTLGAVAAVVVLAAIGTTLYLGHDVISPPPAKVEGRKLVQDVTTWKKGPQTAKTATPDAIPKPDLNWWAKTFNLPKPEQVEGYLQKQGLKVQELEPIHYAETDGSIVITYRVKAESPAELLRLQSVPWNPADPVLARFAPLVVLNQDLPAGYFWDTQHATVAVQVGQKLDFTWNVQVDLANHAVTTDRLPFSNNLNTPAEVKRYEMEAGTTLTSLQQRIQQVYDQTQADLNARLAQIPPDPPKPKPLSNQWGGDGSGEPTKSAARIGGGAAGGAAGGAIFGSIAGNAGLGAGIGAGVGLLGGAIYDAVSKDNDEGVHKRAVASKNAERLDNWKAEIKSLKRQREQAKAAAPKETEQGLENLANQITASRGRVVGPSAVPRQGPQ